MSNQENAETMLGKQLAFNHTLQYVGQHLTRQDVGKILRATPFVNEEQAFDEFTTEYDDVRNDILAIERQEKPPVNKYDDHPYHIKMLVNRVKKPDFRFLDPQIQQVFNQKIQIHEQIAFSFL